MINDITTDTDDGMKKAVDSFKRDLQKIRTGRANTAMLDGIKVDYYGTPTPVNQVATVQVVDARLITVKPWEKAMIAVIDKAIRASDLGINPVADSELVRLPIPPLTQERRRDLAKTVGKQTEEARVAVRSARRDAMDMIKDAEKEKQISEDERKKGEKNVQDLTDKYIASGRGHREGERKRDHGVVGARALPLGYNYRDVRHSGGRRVAARQATRQVRDPGAARAGRHRRDLSRSDRRDERVREVRGGQVPPRSPRRRPRVREDVPRRGAPRRGARSLEHRADVRARRAREPLLHGDGVPRGPLARDDRAARRRSACRADGCRCR